MWTGSTWPPRCETKCASAPRRAGGCREAGLGEEGSRGQWTWPTTLPSVLLTLGAAAPSPRPPRGLGGRDLLPAHTCALRVLSCKFSPVTLSAPALAECSDGRP